MIRRIRRAKKGPLAVAAILATPLFFVGLMAFSLLLDKPTVAADGTLGDPTRGLVATIYLCAFGVSAAIVAVGVVGLLLPRQARIYLPPVAAIGVTIALLVPLGTWETEHTARYPNGVDLIPQKDPSDLILRGEWEQNARRTANQIGLWTIAIAVAAMVIATALEVRRRRGIVSPPPPPPPPEIATGDADITPSARPH